MLLSSLVFTISSMITGVCSCVTYLSVSVLVLASLLLISLSDPLHSIPMWNTRSKLMKVSSEWPIHWASLL
jgi:hypothetical protein